MRARTRIEPKALLPENCSCSGAKLERLLQPAILAILASDHLNGYKVGKKLETMAMFQHRKPDASGMYRTLKELEHRGLIAATAAKSEATEAKVYRVTALGMACLAQWNQTLQSYHEAIGDLLEQCKFALDEARTQKTKGSRASRSCCCRK
jgi:PadR family transcriptional regulator, regulatory protein AphA